MQSASPALEVLGVSKRFPARGSAAVEALHGVSLCLERGQIAGLFGPNGAGKTTLLRAIAGLVQPDAGSVRVDGRAVSGLGAWQRSIGWCPAEDRSFYPRLSGRENLRLFAGLSGLARAPADVRIDGLARDFGLEALLERPFQSYSAGQRQRLNIARALLHRPLLLLLDEPLRSTDPSAAAALAKALVEHARGGGAVLWTGHELRGLEELCSRLEILHQGRIALSGPARDVLARAADPGWELCFASAAARERALERHPELRAGAQPELARLPGAAVAAPAAVGELLRSDDAGLVRVERRERLALAELLARVAAGELRPAGGQHPVAPPEPGLPSSSSERSRAHAGVGLAPFGAVRALARRDMLIFFSYRMQVALRLAMALAWAALFACLGLLVGVGSPRAAGHLRGDYFTYALLGIAFLRLSHAAMVHTAHALRDEQLQGTLEPIHASGRPPLLLLAGAFLWPIASELVAMAFMLAAGALLFGAELGAANWPALLLAGLATLLALACLGVLSCAFVMAFKRGDPVAALFNLAAILLSGVFFPTEMVPAWLQPLSWVLPLTWGLEAVRSAALSGAGFGSPDYAQALARLGLLCVVFAALSVLAYRSAIFRARQRGSLGHA